MYHLFSLKPKILYSFKSNKISIKVLHGKCLTSTQKICFIAEINILDRKTTELSTKKKVLRWVLIYER